MCVRTCHPGSKDPNTILKYAAAARARARIARAIDRFISVPIGFADSPTRGRPGMYFDTLEMTLASAFVLLRNASTPPLCNYATIPLLTDRLVGQFVAQAYLVLQPAALLGVAFCQRFLDTSRVHWESPREVLWGALCGQVMEVLYGPSAGHRSRCSGQIISYRRTRSPALTAAAPALAATMASTKTPQTAARACQRSVTTGHGQSRC